MLRLTLLLCAGMIAALFIAGEDRGQMRPGLAQALAERKLSAANGSPAPEAILPEILADAAPATPDPVTPSVAAPLAPVMAEAEPEPDVELASEPVPEVKEPIFTLSALPTESVPGASEPRTPQAATADDNPEGQIWYVTASSVNVREAPSTDSSVLGKLESGEAALVVADLDGEWARIIIQGDGMEGFVALRYLSPEPSLVSP